MDNKFIDNIADTFNIEPPTGKNFNEEVNKVISSLKKHSEDLREEKFYVGKHLIEKRGDVDYHDYIMHVFNPDEEYLKVVNGNVHCGQWRYLGNKLMFGMQSCPAEVYELAFMDDDVMILIKHGSPEDENRPFLFLLKESLAKKMEWHEALEYLFNKHKNDNTLYIIFGAIIVLIILIVMALS